MSRNMTMKWAAVAVFLAALSAPAVAADLQAMPQRYVPVTNWTGVYIGGHAGGAFGGEDASNPAIGTPVTYSTNPSGFLGGVQAGYNYQFSPSFLVGAEAEMSWSAASGNYNFITTLADGVTNVSGIFNSNQNWYGTVAGRFGYVIGNYMLYAKGGGAWMNADYSLAVTGPFAGGSANLTRSGYVAGGGAQWMFYPGWSAKVEYNYLDFGSSFVPLGVVGATVNSCLDVQGGGGLASGLVLVHRPFRNLAKKSALETAPITRATQPTRATRFDRRRAFGMRT
jgi:opacity protein-like surface antigen